MLLMYVGRVGPLALAAAISMSRASVDQGLPVRLRGRAHRMKRFIIVGLGNFGASVAATLCAAGYDVAAIDTDAERVDQMARKVTRAAVGDGADLRTLKRIGAEDADAAVISTGDDITASALTALVMRDIGVEEIYVKVVSHDHARLIERSGSRRPSFPSTKVACAWRSGSRCTRS